MALFPEDLTGEVNKATFDYTLPNGSSLIASPHGDFFTKNLFVFNKDTGRLLFPALDYKAIYLAKDNSLTSKQEVCKLLYILNPDVKNITVEATYIGGQTQAQINANNAAATAWEELKYEWCSWGAIFTDAVKIHPTYSIRRNADEPWGALDIYRQMEYIRQTLINGDLGIHQHIENWLTAAYQKYFDTAITPMTNRLNALLAEVRLRNTAPTNQFIFSDNIDNSVTKRPGIWSPIQNTLLGDAGTDNKGYSITKSIHQGFSFRASPVNVYLRRAAIDATVFSVTSDVDFVDENGLVNVNLSRTGVGEFSTINVDVISSLHGLISTKLFSSTTNGWTGSFSFNAPNDGATTGPYTLTIRVREYPANYKLITVRDTVINPVYSMAVTLSRNLNLAELAIADNQTTSFSVSISRKFDKTAKTVYVHLLGDIDSDDISGKALLRPLLLAENATSASTTVTIANDALNEADEKLIVVASFSEDPTNLTAVFKTVVVYVKDVPRTTFTNLRFSSKADGSDSILFCGEDATVYLIGELGHNLKRNPNKPSLIIDTGSLATKDVDFTYESAPVVIDDQTLSWKFQMIEDGVLDGLKSIVARTSNSNKAVLWVNDTSYPVTANGRWTTAISDQSATVSTMTEDQSVYLQINTVGFNEGDEIVLEPTVNTGTLSGININPTVKVYGQSARVQLTTTPDLRTSGDRTLTVKMKNRGQVFNAPAILIKDTSRAFYEMRAVNRQGNVITSINEGEEFQIQYFGHGAETSIMSGKFSVTGGSIATGNLATDNFEPVNNGTSFIPNVNIQSINQWNNAFGDNSVWAKARLDEMTEGNQELSIKITPDGSSSQIEVSELKLTVIDVSVDPTFTTGFYATLADTQTLTSLNEGSSCYFIAKINPAFTGVSVKSMALNIVNINDGSEVPVIASNEVNLDTLVQSKTKASRLVSIASIYKTDGTRRLAMGGTVTLANNKVIDLPNSIITINDNLRTPSITGVKWSLKNSTVADDSVLVIEDGVTSLKVDAETMPSDGRTLLEIVDQNGVLANDAHFALSSTPTEYFNSLDLGAINFPINVDLNVRADRLTTGNLKRRVRMTHTHPAGLGLQPTTMTSNLLTISDTSKTPNVGVVSKLIDPDTGNQVTEPRLNQRLTIQVGHENLLNGDKLDYQFTSNQSLVAIESGKLREINAADFVNKLNGYFYTMGPVFKLSSNTANLSNNPNFNLICTNQYVSSQIFADTPVTNFTASYNPDVVVKFFDANGAEVTTLDASRRDAFVVEVSGKYLDQLVNTSEIYIYKDAARTIPVTVLTGSSALLDSKNLTNQERVDGFTQRASLTFADGLQVDNNSLYLSFKLKNAGGDASINSLAKHTINQTVGLTNVEAPLSTSWTQALDSTTYPNELVIYDYDTASFTITSQYGDVGFNIYQGSGSGSIIVNSLPMARQIATASGTVVNLGIIKANSPSLGGQGSFYIVTDNGTRYDLPVVHVFPYEVSFAWKNDLDAIITNIDEGAQFKLTATSPAKQTHNLETRVASTNQQGVAEMGHDVSALNMVNGSGAWSYESFKNDRLTEGAKSFVLEWRRVGDSIWRSVPTLTVNDTSILPTYTFDWRQNGSVVTQAKARVNLLANVTAIGGLPTDEYSLAAYLSDPAAPFYSISNDSNSTSGYVGNIPLDTPQPGQTVKALIKNLTTGQTVGTFEIPVIANRDDTVETFAWKDMSSATIASTDESVSSIRATLAIVNAIVGDNYRFIIDSNSPSFSSIDTTLQVTNPTAFGATTNLTVNVPTPVNNQQTTADQKIIADVTNVTTGVSLGSFELPYIDSSPTPTISLKWFEIAEGTGSVLNRLVEVDHFKPGITYYYKYFSSDGNTSRIERGSISVSANLSNSLMGAGQIGSSPEDTFYYNGGANIPSDATGGSIIIAIDALSIGIGSQSYTMLVQS